MAGAWEKSRPGEGIQFREEGTGGGARPGKVRPSPLPFPVPACSPSFSPPDPGPPAAPLDCVDRERACDYKSGDLSRAVARPLQRYCCYALRQDARDLSFPMYAKDRVSTASMCVLPRF